MLPGLLLRIVLLMPMVSGLASAGAQDIVRGIVVDSATLQALPHVNIQVKNSNAGTITDERGNFAVKAAATDTLLFSLVGYETLELPLAGYDAGMIRLSEKYTLLEVVTIDEYRRDNLYEGMFDEQNAQRKQSIPFYFSKAKKEKIKVQVLKQENLRVKTYVDLVVNNQEFRNSLMKKHGLTEREYYSILTEFNETHHLVMYYLTSAELLSLLNTFFESRTKDR